MNKILQISLLSDMCCGTGVGNGSNVDINAAFDASGLPIIPGKRLKGLLRECAQLLAENNYISADELYSIFGGLSGKGGLLRVDNAQLEFAAALQQQLDQLPEALTDIITAEEVKKSFSSYRSQTALDADGIAKEHSLRTIEVVPQGYVFLSTVMLNDSASEQTARYWEIVDNCARLLRHIGLNKTRGFGEVSCQLLTATDSQATTPVAREYTEYKKLDERLTVPYAVTLADDIVINAGSNKNQDYISGAMVQGAFARFAKDEPWFEEVIINDAVFSNAYIAGDSTTFEPFFPAGFSKYQIKNKDEFLYDFAETDRHSITADGTGNEPQFVALNGYVRPGSAAAGTKPVLETIKVRDSFEYHYTTGIDGAPRNVFTFRKLLKGQRFCGTVTADKTALDLLQQLLANQQGVMYFGGSATAQYAKCSLAFDFNQVCQKPPTIKCQETMIVEFLSDVIVADAYGINTANVSCLQQEVKSLLSFASCKVFTRTRTVGGFNAVWRLPKRQYLAFSKGTVLQLTGCSAGQEICAAGFLGLLNNEGYGQYRIRTAGNGVYKWLDNKNVPVKPAAAAAVEGLAWQQASGQIERVLLDYVLLKSRISALQSANSEFQKHPQLSASAAMRLLNAYQAVGKVINNSQDSGGSYRKAMQEFVDNKLQDNKDLKELGTDVLQTYDRFCRELKAAHQEVFAAVLKAHADTVFREYFKNFLGQLKRNYQKNDAAPIQAKEVSH